MKFTQILNAYKDNVLNCKPLPRKKVILYVCILIFLDIFCFLIQITFNSLLINENLFANFKVSFQDIIEPGGRYDTVFYLTIFIAALGEEIINRLPLSFIFLKFNSEKIRLYSVLISSSLFSLAHFNFISLFEFLMVLPTLFVTGFVYASIYLLIGGNRGKVFLPLLTTFTLHTVWNLSVFILFGY
jgi:hypothetical protein